MEKKCCIPKIWLIIMAVLCLSFIIINAIWLLKIKLPYDHYKAIIRDANSSTWDYTMGINAPENLYLDFRGFELCVADGRQVVGYYNTETGEHILPEVIASFTIVYTLFDTKLVLDVLDMSGEYEGQVFVDKNLHVIEAEGFDESYLSKKQEYIDENYDYLNDILTYGLDTWGIEL